MKEMVMGLVLLASAAVFNPPRIFSAVFLDSPSVFAADEPELRSDYPDFTILINIPATELKLFEDGEEIQRMPIAVGRKDYPTPVGEDAITEIVWNPWWYPPDKEWAKNETITPPGPKNPLGRVKMPLSSDLRLHGTNQDRSIGGATSHACIRLHNADAKRLAWTLQSNLSTSFDENLLKKYSRHPATSFYVKLARPVAVQFVYELIQIEEDQLLLHPDLYQKVGNKREALAEKLKEKGIDPNNIDSERFDEILKKWQKGRGKVKLSLSDLFKPDER